MSRSSAIDQLDQIAIVGMSCRLPGAKNPDEFWRNLEQGVESVSFFSEDELKASGVAPALIANPNYVPARAVIDEPEMFDASFFGFSPTEALITDPQQRLFLECAWEALENAGYNSETYDGAIGVFGGVGFNTYIASLYSDRSLIKSAGSLRVMFGNDKDHLSTRVSYKLNLRGPSVSIQTACSTSLVAVCMACQSLLNYQSDMALAGGVSIGFPQKAGYLYHEDNIASPDGHCRAFDAGAMGTVSGSGAGIVVLKRLADAIIDGDCIHAIIKGFAINNDGSTKLGYTAPSINSQSDVIAMAQSMAEVSPESISYIETHGTGTSLGDPVEIAALTQVFRASTQKKRFCAIGSLKTNIGHLDTAAGVAGLIKAALALKRGMIPPSLHFKKPNPKIDFDNSPFYVNTTLAEWKAGATPRRAGVSSFGIGGTNAHVVLEEAPAAEPSVSSRAAQLLTISARSSAALETATANLADHLNDNRSSNLADVAYTLQIGRKTFKHRRMLVCDSGEDAARELRSPSSKRVITATQDTRDRSVAFLFSGQGTQYVNMALGIYQHEPAFREEFDWCSERLKSFIGADLREIIFPPDPYANEARQTLNQTAVAQPALFALECSLAKMWMKWGVVPKIMIGHSLGEYVAACMARVFTLEEGLLLVAERGRLMQGLTEGAMLSVKLPEEAALKLLDDRLSLASVNGPSSSVISGEKAAIESLEDRLREMNVPAQLLSTSHAFHSEMMEPILRQFSSLISGIRLQPPQIPFISNLTGSRVKDEEATDSAYWVKHLRETVRFADGVREVLKDGECVLLEIGPGQSLSRIVKRSGATKKETCLISSLRSEQDAKSDDEFLLNEVGKLWLSGVTVNWSEFYAHEQRQRLPLPTYPFQRKRYCVEPASGTGSVALAPTSALARQELAEWFYAQTWKRSTLSLLPGRASAQNRRSTWLVFIGRDGAGSQLVHRLRQINQSVVTVESGNQFEKAGEGRYKLDIDSADGYDSLISELRRTGQVPETVLHLWAATPYEDERSESDQFNKWRALGFQSVLGLARALENQNIVGPISMCVISSNTLEVTGLERLRAVKATILGACKAISNQSRMTCRFIDIEVGTKAALEDQQLIDRLIDECVAQDKETVVAYRGNHRWAQLFEPVRLDKVPEPGPCFVDGGVYIIAGARNPNFYIAENIAQNARAKLVLVEDSPEPALARLNGSRPEARRRIGFSVEQEADYLTQLEQRIESVVDMEVWKEREEFQQNIDNLCSSYILDYLATSNLQIEKGVSYDRESLKNALRVLPRFNKFYEFMIGALREDGIIRCENGRIEFLKGKEDFSNTSALRENLEAKYPDFSGSARLLEHCVSNYPKALAGEVEALSVLYPDGDADFLRNLTKNPNNHNDTKDCSSIVSEVVSRLVRGSREATVRVLEVGAGTGYLTGFVAPPLKGENVEYHFTDISKLFLLRAEKEAAKHGLDFMKFGLLDISSDPLEQGYAQQSFDVILALNVIHATRDIEQSLRNIKRLLTPDGVMILVERVRQQRSVNMVWGLTDGWWQFEDTELRRESPLLNVEKWEEVAARQGFKQVKVLPQDPSRRSHMDHAVIIAQQAAESEADYVEQGDSARPQERLRAINRSGSEVMAVRADLSSSEQMKRMIESVHGRFGKIDGLIYTAGLNSYNGAEFEDSNRINSELARRVKGALKLDELLREEADSFVFCSSIASDTQSAGHPAQCAMTAFLDAFAHKIGTRTKKRAVSISWDEGCVKALSGDEDGALDKDKTGIDEFLETFNRTLSLSGAAQVIISPQGLQDLKASNLRRPPVTSTAQADVFAADTPPQDNHLEDAGKTDEMNEIERAVASIWREVLGVESLTLNDNFFDLGGDSLIALQVMSRLRESHNINLPVRTLFESPTLMEFASKVGPSADAIPNSESSPILPAPRDKPLALSYAQHRMWFLDQLNPGSPLYSVPAALRLSGPLRVEVLEKTIGEIIRRHETLRTTFQIVDDAPHQVIAPHIDLTIPITDLSALDEDGRESKTRQLAKEEAMRPFDLAQGPLFRASLVRFGRDEHVLLLTMHHIVSDGWSIGIFLREMTALYEAFNSGESSPLADLPLQYADFAQWQRQNLEDRMQEELSYWKKQLSGNLAALELPTDRPRPEVQSFRGARQKVELSKTLSDSLKNLSQEQGATLFMTLLAAFKVLLHRYTLQDDIIVGSPIANRNRPELESLIGFFANTLVLRTDLSGDPSFRTVLERVRKVALEAYSHQELPFERLVEALQPERDLSRNPLFQVAFVLQNAPTMSPKLSGLEISSLEQSGEEGTSKFDLLLVLTDTPQGIMGALDYTTDLFEAESVRQMVSAFRMLLKSVVEDPDRRISQLDLMTPEEQREVLSASASSAKNRAKLPADLKRHIGRMLKQHSN